MNEQFASGAGTKVTARWFTLFTIAWLVIWTVQLTPLQLLLPQQLDTGQQGDWVQGVVYSGLILGIGGLAAVIAGPLAGALSDRGRPSRPRRRPYALFGTWLTSLGLLLTGLSTTPLTIGASWVAVSIGVAVASAALTAMIADQLPVSQRGAASAASSSAQAVGIVVGVGAVILLGLGVFESYLVLAVTMGVLGTLTALMLPDPSGDLPRASLIPGAQRFAFVHDEAFMWMLSGRLVVNIGNALGTALFLFFLMYGLGQPALEAEDNLLLVIVVYTVFVVAASVLAGMYSDRKGHRRGLTAVAALVQAASGVVLVISPTFTMTMIAAALMGAGYGAFMAVGLAFATDLLPSQRDHARDLGVVNVVAALGQLLGPVIGACLVALVGGFWLVFVTAATLSVIGAGLTALARRTQPA